jgi:hypothetical protein
MSRLCGVASRMISEYGAGGVIRIAREKPWRITRFSATLRTLWDQTILYQFHKTFNAILVVLIVIIL